MKTSTQGLKTGATRDENVNPVDENIIPVDENRRN